MVNNRRTLLRLSALLLALILVVTACSQGAAAPPPDKSQRATAPDFTGIDLYGKQVSLADLRGKVVVINFWSIDCPPCIEEMPYIQAFHKKWSDRGVVVLAVNLDSRRPVDDIKEFMEENSYSFTVLYDPGWKIGQKYFIRQYPTTFFIDSEGMVRLMRIGAFTGVRQMEDYLSRTMQ